MWVSASLHERVNLWRTCSWLRHLGFAHHDIFVLDFEPVPPSRAASRELLARPFTCSESVSNHADEVLLDRLGKARPWSGERVRSRRLPLGQLRRREPLVVRRRAAGLASKAFRSLLPCGRSSPASFQEGPRREPCAESIRRNRSLCLSTEWQTPAGVAAQKSETLVDMWHLLFCTGDLFLPRRLEHWANHDSSAAVERAPGPKPPNAGYPMLSEVYRLTERGMRLRRRDSTSSRMRQACPSPAPRRTRLQLPGCCSMMVGSLDCKS